MSAPIALPRRSRFAAVALLFLVVLTYSSTIVGPIGVNYEPISPEIAWRKLLAVKWIQHGSDQRADWMGNLSALVSVGFLLAGAIMPRHGVFRRVAGALATWLAAFACIIGIKFLQLYFPPRTVTLNYITAQSIGAALGIVLFIAADRFVTRIARLRATPEQLLVTALLAAYAFQVASFALSPYDIALSADDWRLRLRDLGSVLLQMPAAERSPGVRLLLVGAAMAGFAPLGLLLERTRPRRSWLRLGLVALAIATVLTLAPAITLSGQPRLVGILYRTAGILAGAAALRLADHPRIRALAPLLPPLALLAAPLYVLAVLYANGLITTHWRSIAQAWADADKRLFIPLWAFYIVSKGTAAFSLAAHLAMYAPLGVLVWMRAGDSRAGRWTAATLAALLSFAVEWGRFLHPGPTPDFNEVPVAAIAAYAAVRLAALPWLERLDHPRAPAEQRPGTAPMPSRFGHYLATGHRAGEDPGHPPG